MKTGMLLSLLLVVSIGVAANDGKYLELMQKNIKAIYEASEIAELQQVINSLERIAAVEKDKWEPLYYIAYGNIMMAMKERDGAKKDAYLDAAGAYINRAKSMHQNDSELAALEGFASMIRITVDPQSRGPVHAPTAMQLFNKALGLDKENPRALALMAQMQFGTAQFFNSSTSEPCELNRKAIATFESSTPKGPLSPTWGLAMAKGLAAQCK